MEKNIITFEQLQIILGVKESAIKTLIKENDFPESVFCEWTEDKHSYLLRLTIYSTGLGNS